MNVFSSDGASSDAQRGKPRLLPVWLGVQGSADDSGMDVSHLESTFSSKDLITV